MYSNDKRTVVTLDAGGTNFVFGAIQGNKQIVNSITTPSNSHDLDLCLKTLSHGFANIIESLDTPPVAISFAFPGPADYPSGIIGGYLPNFPSFREGVALGPYLEEKFGIPVFINNDADLFAYGEAMAGALPRVNEMLEKEGSAKRYSNLLAYTWGTGFGFGFASSGKLHIGDNSCTETFCLPLRHHPEIIAEEGVSARAIVREYLNAGGEDLSALKKYFRHTGAKAFIQADGSLLTEDNFELTPATIFNIAEGAGPGGEDPGISEQDLTLGRSQSSSQTRVSTSPNTQIARNRTAAIKSFQHFGEASGDAIATAATLIDGLIVIGGGITAARKYIMPSLLSVMREKMHTFGGDTLGRLQFSVYDLDNPQEFSLFAKGGSKVLDVYGTTRKVTYDPQKRTGITISTLGASRAISLGAYSYALSHL